MRLHNLLAPLDMETCLCFEMSFVFVVDGYKLERFLLITFKIYAFIKVFLFLEKIYSPFVNILHTHMFRIVLLGLITIGMQSLIQAFPVQDTAHINMRLSLFFSVNNATCSQKNGTISIKINGGNPPYRYSWSTGDTLPEIHNLGYGSYYVHITDKTGNQLKDTITVSNSAYPIFVNVQKKDATCGEDNGFIRLSAMGAGSPFRYQWNSGEEKHKIEYLSGGAYQAIVSNQYGCADTVTVTLQEGVKPTFSLQSQPATCHGKKDGSIQVVLPKAQPLAKYKWNTGQVTPSLSQLEAGTYHLTYTDDKGCTAMDSVVVGQPVAMEILADATGCNNVHDVHLSTIGGSAPYTYLWSNDLRGDNAHQLPSGEYAVQVTDANGCMAAKTFSLYTEKLTATITVKDNLCFDDAKGGIHIQSVIGGEAPYTYSLDGKQFDTNPDFEHLNGGEYVLYIQDNKGCIKQDTFFVNMPIAPLAVEIQPLAGANGLQLEAKGFNAKPPLRLTWESQSALGCSTCTKIDVPSTQKALFSVTLTDADGCTAKDNYYTYAFLEEKGLEADYYPTIITPNGDGRNDVFIYRNLNLRNCQLSIFDKKGKEIYTYEGQTPSWNASYGGGLAPEGVYGFSMLISLTDGTQKEIKGKITVVK